MMTYILIGIVFMFFIEWCTHTDFFKKHIARTKVKLNTPAIGWTERIIGIFLWPVCLGIFLYSFFKEYFK